MKSGTIPSRPEQIDYVSSELLPRAALLTRLLVRQLGGELSRTEIGLLKTLGGGSRRITELAEFEDYRGWLRAVLGGYLAEIADEQVEALATATETLAQLVGILQQRPAR